MFQFFQCITTSCEAMFIDWIIQSQHNAIDNDNRNDNAFKPPKINIEIIQISITVKSI